MMDGGDDDGDDDDDGEADDDDDGINAQHAIENKTRADGRNNIEEI